MKKMIFVFIVVLVSISNISATTSYGHYHVFDGNGLAEYPNSGFVSTSLFTNTLNSGALSCDAFYWLGSPHKTIYVYAQGAISAGCDEDGRVAGKTYRIADGQGTYEVEMALTFPENGGTAFETGTYETTFTDGGMAEIHTFGRTYNTRLPWIRVTNHVYISPIPIITYNLSGNTSCVKTTKLYTKVNSTTNEFLLINVSYPSIEQDQYNFTILNSLTYRIDIEDSNNAVIDSYEFICGSDIIKDFYKCNSSTFNLFDDCSNALINATTTIFVNNIEQIYQGNDNPIIINESGNYSRHDKFSVIIDTHDMAAEKTVFADNEQNTFNLYHQFVGWDLQTFVYDNYTKNAIDMVKVSTYQTCRIGGYEPNTQGFTNVNGVVTTYQLSNQNFTIECEHANYHDYSFEFVTNFDAQKSTYMVEIYLDNSSSEYEDGNETLPETPCSITWSNNDNLIIHEINDTEDARLHYMAGSTTTLLYLERWSEVSDTWVLIGSSHTLTPLEQGYIQYTPINWTEDETTIYRGRLWALNCYCDTTSSLKVWNSTDINEVVFKNLTANVRFKDKISGSEVSPVSPILIKAYAASNNTTLLTIDLKLYNESALVETESLSFFDWYIDGSFTPYRWYPEYTYTDGYNYTVKMFGIGNALLDVDTVYANSSSPLFDNYELTVFVLDNYNHQVTHSTVFVEGWGSISTGDKYYVSISGFPEGTYQYKATKAGYISSGWASVELDNHESVNCVLVSETQTSITASKMTNAEIKAFFIPLMYLMLIMMLLGAFKFACGGK